MNIVKKNFKYLIVFAFGVISTTLISSTYAAYSYVGNASDITYSNTSTNLASNNVEGAISELADRSKYGNASSSDILSGKTALSNGNKIIGSMINNGAVSASINPGNSYTISAGYHDGNGKIECNTCPDLAVSNILYSCSSGGEAGSKRSCSYTLPQRALVIAKGYGGYSSGGYHSRGTINDISIKEAGTTISYSLGGYSEPYSFSSIFVYVIAI